MRREAPNKQTKNKWWLVAHLVCLFHINPKSPCKNSSDNVSRSSRLLHIFTYTTILSIEGNIANTDQNALTGAVRSGSTLLIEEAFLTFQRTTNLTTFVVNCTISVSFESSLYDKLPTSLVLMFCA